MFTFIRRIKNQSIGFPKNLLLIGFIIASLFSYSIAAADRTFSLPDQTGQSGKFLQTNGTMPLWAAGGGGGGGTVTSVGLTVPTGFTVSGSPVTASGTLGVTYTGGDGILQGIAGAISPITIGTGLSFSAGTLSATGGAGTVTQINTQQSITGGPITSTGTINLVNDTATPGNLKYYGTDGSGTRGWFALTNSLPALTQNHLYVGNTSSLPVDGGANFQYNPSTGVQTITQTSGIFIDHESNANTTLYDKFANTSASASAAVGLRWYNDLGLESQQLQLSSVNGLGGNKWIFDGVASTPEFVSRTSVINFNTVDVFDANTVMRIFNNGHVAVGANPSDVGFLFDDQGTFHTQGVNTLTNLGGSGSGCVATSNTGVLSFTTCGVGGIVTSGNLTDAGTDGITVTAGTNAVLGAGTSFAQHVADATHNGYLSSTNFSTFSNNWSLGGNAGTTSANFIGTTDTQGFRIKVNSNTYGLFHDNLVVAGTGTVTASGIGSVGIPANTDTGQFFGIDETVPNTALVERVIGQNSNSWYHVWSTAREDSSTGSAGFWGTGPNPLGVNTNASGKGTYMAWQDNTGIVINSISMTASYTSTPSLDTGGIVAVGNLAGLGRAYAIGDVVYGGQTNGMIELPQAGIYLFGATNFATGSQVGVEIGATTVGSGNTGIGSFMTGNSTNIIVTDTAKTINFNGGVVYNYVAVTATYAIQANDYTVDSNGTFTDTLPTAVGIKGQVYVVKNSGSGVITLGTTSSQLIDGTTTKTLATGNADMVQSTGTGWIII